jgi:hypothetical protein
LETVGGGIGDGSHMTPMTSGEGGGDWVGHWNWRRWVEELETAAI